MSPTQALLKKKGNAYSGVPFEMSKNDDLFEDGHLPAYGGSVRGEFIDVRTARES